MDPDWASSVLEQASVIPQEAWPWEQTEVEGEREGEREERREEGFGSFYPELKKNKSSTGTPQTCPLHVNHPQ